LVLLKRLLGLSILQLAPVLFVYSYCSDVNEGVLLREKRLEDDLVLAFMGDGGKPVIDSITLDLTFLGILQKGRCGFGGRGLRVLVFLQLSKGFDSGCSKQLSPKLVEQVL